MELERGAFTAVERQRLLHGLFCLVVAPQPVEDPCVCVEVRRISLFEGDGPFGHCKRPFQIALGKREEIGVVVEHHRIILPQCERPVVGIVALSHVTRRRPLPACEHLLFRRVFPRSGGGLLGLHVVNIAHEIPDGPLERIALRQFQ